MVLKELLQKNKAAIARRWLDRTLATYPSRTSVFLKRKRDRFANPVGHAFGVATQAIVEELVDGFGTPQGFSVERVCEHLERIIKIRSVQQFTASQAVSFVFYLKQAVREELEEELRRADLMMEWVSLEAQIDQLALFAFDIHMKCREKLYELRLNEIKRTGFRLLRNANLISIDEDTEPEEDRAGSEPIRLRENTSADPPKPGWRRREGERPL